MKTALFKIGDKVKRIDCDDPKIYTIDKIRKSKGDWIYCMSRQGWKDGWAWMAPQGCIFYK